MKVRIYINLKKRFKIDIRREFRKKIYCMLCLDVIGIDNF